MENGQGSLAGNGSAVTLDPGITAHLDAMEHPLRKELEMLRRAILSADPSIAESLKWNTASYRTTEWFATLNGPRQKDRPVIILHAGAKAKGLVLEGRIADPDGLLVWLGKDRAMIGFRDLTDITAKQQSLERILKEWILHL